MGSQKFKQVKNRATKLRRDPHLVEDKLPELKKMKFDEWAGESVKLAKQVTYRHGKLKGSRNDDEAPTLPANYKQSVKPVAERRLVVSGYRLAQLLDRLFKFIKISYCFN